MGSYQSVAHSNCQFSSRSISVTELLTLAQLSVVLYIMQVHVLEVKDMNISLLLVASELFI